MAAATRKRQRSAAAARPPRALFATALVTLAGWCSASSTKTDWANGVTPEWRHPAERRVSSNDANELIKLAKADAIATSLPSPRERPPPQPPLQHVSFKPAAPPLLRPPRAHQQHSMLYLDVFIDGHAVRAFVDTGAQVTVMSAPCAARCGLLGQLDKRYAGRAVGVGSARILGRIPDAHLSLHGCSARAQGGQHVPVVCDHRHRARRDGPAAGPRHAAQVRVRHQPAAQQRALQPAGTAAA
eukprot:TRINITY_DN8561_c0_g1_i1.p2 TRINITY_DN8561_c0_g1~~TRINITY_DN8561_c0_g1_i1.p2  ORF type:complete len:242 (+),score=66.26 TRINITY_DN8561_c0_g1_i1:117-842(+)